jgi:hypothetical protein
MCNKIMKLIKIKIYFFVINSNKNNIFFYLKIVKNIFFTIYKINMIIIIIILLILFIIYLEYKSYKEEKEESYILNNYNSNLPEIFNSFNEKDKLLLKDFIISITKTNSNRKHKRKIYNSLIDSVATLSIIYILAKYTAKQHILDPVTSALNYIITSMILP